MDNDQNKKLDILTKDVQSLTFDNERVIKPAIKDIRDILSRDIYATKNEHSELKLEVENLRKEVEDEKKKTANYVLVERVVFGLVTIVLLAVVGALVGLVVTSNK